MFFLCDKSGWCSMHSPITFQTHFVQYNIVSAFFSFFFKDLNVLAAVFFTIAYRLPNSSYSNLCLAFSKFILKSFKPELQYSYQHAVMVNS